MLWVLWQQEPECKILRQDMLADVTVRLSECSVFGRAHQ